MTSFIYKTWWQIAAGPPGPTSITQCTKMNRLKINPNMEIFVWTPMMVHRHFIKFAFTLFSIRKQTAKSIFHSVLSEIPPASASARACLQTERKRVRCLKLAPHLRIGYFGTLVVYVNFDSNTVPNRRALWALKQYCDRRQIPGLVWLRDLELY